MCACSPDLLTTKFGLFVDYFCWYFCVSAQVFRPMQLKHESTQRIDLDNSYDWSLMKKTGEIVFICLTFEERIPFLYLYTLQQGRSMEKKKIKLPCQDLFTIMTIIDRFSFKFLFIHIMWREYLVISCEYCGSIHLVDLETMEVTTAFSDGQNVKRILKGWHKIYVERANTFLELDCSSTKFSKIRQISVRKNRFESVYNPCYVPPPHNMLLSSGFPPEGCDIYTTSLDEPNETKWFHLNKQGNGKMIEPRSIIYSSRNDALLVLDSNKAIWVLKPGTWEILQTIDLPKMYPQHAIQEASQLVLISEVGNKIKINRFSIN